MNRLCFTFIDGILIQPDAHLYLSFDIAGIQYILRKKEPNLNQIMGLLFYSGNDWSNFVRKQYLILSPKNL